MKQTSKTSEPIYKKVSINPSTLAVRVISRFQSERFVFTVEKEGVRHKIFQVIFGKSDGSLYISFPYFDITEGLLSIGTIPEFKSTLDIDLKPTGKVTSNRIKFSHHPDGEAHFSQDGKVLTSIRRKSVLLEEVEGHIFTITAQGLGHFEKGATEDKNRVKSSKVILNFRLENKKPAIKFVARWYKFINILKDSVGSNIGSLLTTIDHEGRRDSAFIIGPLEGQLLESYALIISCEEIPPVDKDHDRSLVFVGGFDSRKIHNDITKPSSFLCLSYPISDYENLKQQIGSIDLANTKPNYKPIN